ncbi:ANK_REP_REGION domain-containing protein [Durusdinium trenchii]|uniref:tRNA (guanine(46)-N(7))-methyltransferase n=1 Tax=Durusdinium trenchii TaxID=1381693 RepID=A0ABP0QTW2_9DINO
MRLGALLTLGVTWPLLFATPKLGLVKRAVESGDVEILRPLPRDLLLQLRQELRHERRFTLADRVLELLRPQLEAEELWVEDGQDGRTRLVPHPRARKAADAHGASASKAARQSAQEALQRSLWADTEEDARAAGLDASMGVRGHLKELPSWDEALKGRQAADLALSLSLAGSEDLQLFEDLASISERELRSRTWRSLVSVQQMIERLATAGYRQQDFPGLFEAALSTLESLGCRPSSNLRDLRAGNFSLHSPRPLVWLYRHATRQGRRCIPPASSKVHEELARLNNRCPLVLDLGCGFGAAALGLADEFAVLGVDASAHCIGYAKALAQRWQLAKKVSFVQCAAEEALAAAKDFGGEMEWILISFPTPFAAPADSRLCMETFTSGNSHLPEHVDSAEFMANVKMLEEARQCLLTHGGDGKLLIQSNVEDMAVTLRGLAEANGWEAVTDGSLGPEVHHVQAPEWQSRRQKQWQRHSGHRAAGAGWLKSSPLPRLARTETEAHYIAESLPIHRFALRPAQRKTKAES